MWWKRATPGRQRTGPVPRPKNGIETAAAMPGVWQPVQSPHAGLYSELVRLFSCARTGRRFASARDRQPFEFLSFERCQDDSARAGDRAETVEAGASSRAPLGDGSVLVGASQPRRGR